MCKQCVSVDPVAIGDMEAEDEVVHGHANGTRTRGQGSLAYGIVRPGLVSSGAAGSGQFGWSVFGQRVIAFFFVCFSVNPSIQSVGKDPDIIERQGFPKSGESGIFRE